jgi:hypothetical protein
LSGGSGHCIAEKDAKSVEIEKHGSKKIVETKMTPQIFGFQPSETSKKTSATRFWRTIPGISGWLR